MEDTPTSKLRSAAQGYVELSGYGALLEGAPIIAPLTGLTCTWYSHEIEERRRSGKNTHWVDDVLDPAADVRDILKEWKQDAEYLLKRFDTNKDGKIDMQEWQKVRHAALQEVMANHGERQTEAPVNLMARTRDKRRPFLLSAVSQHALIRRCQFYSAGLILLFFISGAFVSWAINLRLAGA